MTPYQVLKRMKMLKITPEQMAHVFELKANGDTWEKISYTYDFISICYLRELYYKAKREGMSLFKKIYKGARIYSEREPWSGKIYAVYKNYVSVILNNGKIIFIDKEGVKYKNGCLVEVIDD